MMKFIIVPVIPHINSHYGRGMSGLEILFCILFSIYLTNILMVCVNRSLGYYNRKEFLIKLIIPFSVIGKSIIDLFTKD